ncbi:hypothetical protein WPS_05230 [Vulcanimicrobium alpinum]|uniref:DUF1501 domain-containing protein n=1 Tax=Vulcanimicrobium alpinum TaxID=3016050 RepID=A0AAN2C960_UNVUL|nr:DUF1501 domain-containing protein [Vulcanimicrobium alpinum]BDE05247.1 hypothetical protein WPS_05230 [Vulcanimicrobium alpinum]
MKRSTFLLGAISGLSVVGTFDNVFAQALAQSPLPGLPAAADRVLLVINFQGGNDGLNTVVPFGMPEYYRYRPSIGIPQSDVLRIDDTVGLNPSLAPFKKMYDGGKVAIVQGVGYPDPDHSHFRSTEIWQTAAPKAYESTGWLGRYLDDAGLPPDNLFNAVALNNILPEVLIAKKTDVPAIDALRGYGLRSDRRTADREAFHEFVRDRSVPFRSPFLAQVAQIEDHAQRGAEELPKLVAGYKTEANYPATPLGRSLALAAQIVGSKLGTRVLYIQHGSFDTHVTQKATQDRLLADFANAITAFYDDLAAHGNDGRVLTMTFSEFGRRVAENASRGTDHGEAAPVFLIGGGVKGGLYGQHPDLSRLSMGNLAYSTDFRSVYATVLERWLGRPSVAIVGGSFATLPALA